MAATDPRLILGRTIRVHREQRALSQEKLAELCGLHRTYIGSVEQGEKNVSLLNIVAIARTLGHKPFQLLQQIS